VPHKHLDRIGWNALFVYAVCDRCHRIEVTETRRKRPSAFDLVFADVWGRDLMYEVQRGGQALRKLQERTGG